MGPRQANGFFGRSQSGLASSTASARGPPAAAELRLGRLLLQLGLNERLLGLIALCFGNFLSSPQRPQSIERRAGSRDGRLRLLDGDFQPLSVFGARLGLQ